MGSTRSSTPCEMKIRGRPWVTGGAAKPGEKASTASTRSPLARPSDSAYEAPSEKPPERHVAHRVAVEGGRQQSVDTLDVRPEAASDQVPTRRRRVRGDQQQVVRVRDGQQQVQPLSRRAARTVQEQHQPVRRAVGAGSGAYARASWSPSGPVIGTSPVGPVSPAGGGGWSTGRAGAPAGVPVRRGGVGHSGRPSRSTEDVRRGYPARQGLTVAVVR